MPPSTLPFPSPFRHNTGTWYSPVPDGAIWFKKLQCRCTTDHAIVTRIAQEVVEDFARENVVYLELRTTPKDRPEHRMTKRSYVEAVLRGIENYKQEASELHLHLLQIHPID